MIASTNHNRQTSGPLNAPDVHGLNFEAICEITNEKNVHTKPFVSVQRVDYTALSTNELVATVRRVCIQEGKPLVIENLHKADTWRPELFTLDWLAENAPDLRFEPRNTTDRTNGPEISLAEYIDYIRDPHHGWERIRQKTDEQDSTLEQDLSSIKQEQILDESSQGTTPTVSRTTENDVRHHHRNPISSQSSSMSPTPPDAKPSDTPPRSSSPMAPRPPTDHQDSKALVSGEPNEQCQPANREQRESVVDGSAYAREATDSSYTLTGGITGENSNTVITDQSVYPAEVDVDITMFDSERGMNDDEAETEEVMEAGEIAKDNTRYDFKNVIAAGQVLVKSEPFDCPIVKVESQNDEAPPPTLYGKDIDCPDAWRQYVGNELLPSWFVSMRENDLFSSLPKQLRPENLMIYVGIGGTWTPGHKDMCASFGHNLMCYADEDASAFWFMARTADKEKAAQHWRSFGESVDVDTHLASVAELATVEDFQWIVIEQKLGDFVLVPSESVHQVINKGGVTIKVSWNRTTAETLCAAYHNVLPLYKSILRPEAYNIKTIIFHTLQRWCASLRQYLDRLDSGDCNPQECLPLTIEGQNQFKRDFQALVEVYGEMLKEEWVENVQWDGITYSGDGIRQDETSHSDVTLTTNEVRSLGVAQLQSGTGHGRVCDFCKCDIWNRLYHCEECIAGKEVTPPTTNIQGDGRRRSLQRHGSGNRQHRSTENSVMANSDNTSLPSPAPSPSTSLPNSTINVSDAHEYEGYDLCLDCYASGRTCAHVQGMHMAESISMADCVAFYRDAVGLLNRWNAGDGLMLKDEFENSSPEQNQQLFSTATAAKRVEVTRGSPLKDHSCPRCRVIRKGICLRECDGCLKQWCYDCLYTWNGIRFRDIWSKRKFLCPECIGECSCAKPRCRDVNLPLQHQPDPIEFLFTDPNTESRNWGAISDPCERRAFYSPTWGPPIIRTRGVRQSFGGSSAEQKNTKKSALGPTNSVVGSRAGTTNSVVGSRAGTTRAKGASRRRNPKRASNSAVAESLTMPLRRQSTKRARENRDRQPEHLAAKTTKRRKSDRRASTSISSVDNDNTSALNPPLHGFTEAVREFCRKQFSEGPSGLIDMERKVREVFGSDVSQAFEQDVAMMIRNGAECTGKLVDEGKSWFEVRRQVRLNMESFC